MAHIPYVDEGAAEGLLAKLYRMYGGEKGGVDNILRIHSLNPRSLQVHHDLYRHLLYGPSDLSRIDREMIGVVVSRVNSCHY